MSEPRIYYQDETGLCGCGCGQRTELARQTVNRVGLKKGQPRRFLTGHNLIGHVKTAEHRQRISASLTVAWGSKRQRMPVGSTRKDVNGYVLVKTRVGAGRWDKQHILVVEEVIGRRLFPDEVVHHINGIRDDNRPENLYLCRDKNEHGRVHASFDKLLARLVGDGSIRFNASTGEYEG